MTSDEQRALSRAHQPWNTALWAMVLTFIVVILATAFTGAKHPGTFEHFLGQSTKQTATVTQIEKVGFCSRDNRDEYTITWNENGIQHSHVIGKCGDPWEVGDEITIWATGKTPRTDHPLALQITAAALVIGLGLTTVTVVRHRNRVRRAAARVLNGTWQPEVYPTQGVAGLPGFQINTPTPIHSRRLHWTRKIYTTQVRVAPPSGIPGTLYIDSLRGGRPRGISLHELQDGTRFWRWHGGLGI